MGARYELMLPISQIPTVLRPVGIRNSTIDLSSLRSISQVELEVELWAQLMYLSFCPSQIPTVLRPVGIRNSTIDLSSLRSISQVELEWEAMGASTFGDVRTNKIYSI